ncbi:DUF1481 domain-containing protein [Shewanella sp. 10N.286.48.B5]|uniref:DUF1481 domain-containing protein n=1 Tax=Shewanella sp. 10N.286.48.B5 TaxID=1880834 RepID=UPI0039A67CF2
MVKMFQTCSGQQFTDIEFNQTLPNFVINRLSSVESYGAFVGKGSLRKLSVAEFLMLADDNHQCIARPSLLKE